VGFDGILNEDVVALGLEGEVVFDSEVSGSVDGNGSVVTLVDGVVLDVGVVDGTDQVHVESVSSELEGLADVLELDVLSSESQRVVSW